MTMTCNLTGAVVNTVLDALFVFVFEWGMQGAALATALGQIVAAMLVVWGLKHCRTVKLEKKHLIPNFHYVIKILSLGFANWVNQVAMMVVQIIMNQSLKYYGSRSVYGESVPIACSGIIMKVNMLFMSFVIGLSQGLQPIAGFNYGAKIMPGSGRHITERFSAALLWLLLLFGVSDLSTADHICFWEWFGGVFSVCRELFSHIFILYLCKFYAAHQFQLFTAIGKPVRELFSP